MRRLILISILIFSISILSAEIINTEINFNEPNLEYKAGETVIKFDNCTNTGVVGEPTLPYYGLKLLMPYNNTAKDVKIVKNNFVELPGKYTLPVYQPQYPLSDDTLHAPVTANPIVYSSNNPYPSQNVKNLKTSLLAGYSLATAAITPIEYIPATGKLGYYSSIKVILETTKARTQPEINVNNTADQIVNLVTSNVENPDQILSYNMNRDRENIDLLIIAAEGKLDIWQQYANIYSNMNYNIMMHTVEAIEAEVNGNDLPEKIRRYIKNTYMNNNLTNVLLAGDTDVIPERGFYVDNGSQSDDNIPADMYYACLDGTWNTDNDAYWGETTEADLAPELAIGRFCYNNDSEIENFINKVEDYWHSPIANEVTTSLFVGEYLWEGPTWGGDYMDELIGESSTNGHETTGIPTDWQISKLYERDEDWYSSDIQNELSNGPNLVNHLGHSSVGYNMKLYTSQVNDNSITNDGEDHGYSIHFSQGCYAGSFDNRSSGGYFGEDCITEKFTSISNSAVSMISHSRYGWGQQGSTNGASQFLHREWVDAIFGENIVDLGYTLMDVKIDIIPFLDSPTMYWVDYETNLIGDPLLKIRTQTPTEIIATHLEQIEVGATELEIITDLNNANIVLTQNDMVVAFGNTGLYGETTLQFVEPIQTLDPLQLQISKYNYLTYTAPITVVNSENPYIIAPEAEYVENGDYNDGFLQSNDILDMNVTFQNLGNSNTTSQTVATLSCSNDLVSILQAETTLENMEANGTLTSENAFQLHVEPGIIEATEIELVVTVDYGSEVWESSLNLPLVAPQIQYVEPMLSLISGDDEQLNPGENAELYIIYENSGSGVSYDLTTTVFCNDPYITVTGSDLIPSIDPDQQVTTWSPIQISVAQDCPVDHEFNLDLMAYDNIGVSVFQTITMEVVYNVANDNNLPLFTSLEKNYPNPFNPQTNISYSLKQTGPVKLQIFNAKGQLVRTLIDETQLAGKYNAIWYGKNDSGKPVGSGIYFYKMKTKDYQDIQRMLLLK